MYPDGDHNSGWNTLEMNNMISTIHTRAFAGFIV